MRRRWRQILIPALLVIVTGLVYGPRLQEAPVFLSNDEVCIALNARAIAGTGRDVDGRFMPSLFHSPAFLEASGIKIWFLPMLVYSVALVLKVLPFTETAIRLPLVIAAMADVLLVYFISRLLFERERVAVLTALLMVLTPAHFFHARLALPAQFSGPFVLGWLLCVLLYLRHGDPRLLFGSGVLLGLAAIGYIGPLAIAYGLLTWGALSLRREPWPRYMALVLGGLLPCLYLVWLWLDASVVQEILGHYQQPQAQHGWLGRLSEVASLYGSFWSPRFLFVEGAVRNAHEAGAIGVFVLPAAGLMGLGLMRAARRFDAEAVLLLGGFFSAPLAASFVGERQAIWRALEVAPFGVLLAGGGLHLWLSEDTPPRQRWAAYVVAFATAMIIAAEYREQLQHAQPMIRVLLVPLVVAGLATLLRRLPAAPLPPGGLAVPVASLAIVELLFVTRYADLAALPALALALLALSGWRSSATGADRRLAAVLAVTSLTLLAAEFMFLHVDYPVVGRLGPLPASAVLMAMRMATAGVVVAAALGAVTWIRRTQGAGNGSTAAIVAMSMAMILLQVGYFHVDFFIDHLARLVFVSLLLVLAIGFAAVLAGMDSSHRLFPRLGAVALAAAAVIQFGYYYTDYFNGSQLRNVVVSAGNGRSAWEAVIARANRQPVPAVFVGSMGAYKDAGLYWRFYLIKHHREDLLARTIEGEPFERDRIRRLPAGSVIVTSPSTAVDEVVRQLRDAGDVARPDTGDLIHAPDGTPLFWVLERSAS